MRNWRPLPNPEKVCLERSVPVGRVESDPLKDKRSDDPGGMMRGLAKVGLSVVLAAAIPAAVRAQAVSGKMVWDGTRNSFAWW